MVFEHLFTEMAAVLAISALVGATALWLRQPLIVAFIIVGIIVGPVGLSWVSDEQFDLLAEMGIGLLLFVVGLKLDPALICSVGPVSAVTGLGQMLLSFGFGYLLAWLLGMTAPHAFYVAAALTFSSTIIIVKLLSDKREIDALYGRIALGVLIMQDIVVVLLMLGLAAYGSEVASLDLGQAMLSIFLKGVSFLLIVSLASRYLLPLLLRSFAHLPELLVLFGIAWAIGLGALGVGLGFSKEVGAFIAGVSLAATPYRPVLAARLVSLRDFMLLFFFIDLGVSIDVVHFGAAIGPALVLSVFVLIGKPLMVMLLVSAMGYTKRTSAMSGFSLGQISEFSLILAALGVSLGHIDEETMGLITLVGLITIGLSTYMILYAPVLYERLLPLLTVFERKNRHVQEEALGDKSQGDDVAFDVIVFGVGRYGGRIAHEFKQRGLVVLGVDFDPEILRQQHQRGIPTLYGDVDDSEIFHALPLNQVSWVVSTLASRDHGQALLHALQHFGFQGRVAVTAHNDLDREALITAGADRVLMPFRDASKEAVDLMLKESADAEITEGC
jgi:Kef-type K+ transport system membrane component KefB